MKQMKKASALKNTNAKSGETRQTTTADNQTLTTNQGIPISDNQNSLKAGGRGPALLDFRDAQKDHAFRPPVMAPR